MQAVFVCGGKGTRLVPRHVSAKCLVSIGGMTLLARLARTIGGLHSSLRAPVVIVDAQDSETPAAVAMLTPQAQVVRHPEPGGVANALLLAEAYLDECVVVALGDLFLERRLRPVPADADACVLARSAD